jgi:hypothetical protein
MKVADLSLADLRLALRATTTATGADSTSSRALASALKEKTAELEAAMHRDNLSCLSARLREIMSLSDDDPLKRLYVERLNIVLGSLNKKYGRKDYGKARTLALAELHALRKKKR